MRNQKLWDRISLQICKWQYPTPMWSYYRPPHYIHTQHGVLFVAHKAIIVRTSKILSCLSHIFLILTGVSRDGRKITAMKKHLTISFGAQRNQYKTDKIVVIGHRFEITIDYQFRIGNTKPTSYRLYNRFPIPYFSDHICLATFSICFCL